MLGDINPQLSKTKTILLDKLGVGVTVCVIVAVGAGVNDTLGIGYIKQESQLLSIDKIWSINKLLNPLVLSLTYVTHIISPCDINLKTSPYWIGLPLKIKSCVVYLYSPLTQSLNTLKPPFLENLLSNILKVTAPNI